MDPVQYVCNVCKEPKDDPNALAQCSKCNELACKEKCTVFCSGCNNVFCCTGVCVLSALRDGRCALGCKRKAQGEPSTATKYTRTDEQEKWIKTIISHIGHARFRKNLPPVPWDAYWSDWVKFYKGQQPTDIWSFIDFFAFFYTKHGRSFYGAQALGHFIDTLLTKDLHDGGWPGADAYNAVRDRITLLRGMLASYFHNDPRDALLCDIIEYSIGVNSHFCKPYIHDEEGPALESLVFGPRFNDIVNNWQSDAKRAKRVFGVVPMVHGREIDLGEE